MKLQLVVLGIYFYCVVLQCSPTASIYKCAESNLKENKCMMMNIEYVKVGEVMEPRRVYSLKNCSKNQVCLSLSDNSNAGYCVDKLSMINGFDGDECKNSEDCYSFNCDKGKCVGIENGLRCTDPYSCLKYSACIKKDSAFHSQCIPIVQSNTYCFSDSMCQIGYVCGKSSKSSPNKQCLKMFTIENGSYVSHELLCKSGRIWTYDKGENYFCSTSKKNGAEPCKENECKVTISNGRSSFTYKSNSCSWNGVDSYLTITNEDEVFNTYLKTYMDAIQKVNVDDLKNIEYARYSYWEDTKLAALATNVFYFAQMKGRINAQSNTF